MTVTGWKSSYQVCDGPIEEANVRLRPPFKRIASLWRVRLSDFREELGTHFEDHQGIARKKKILEAGSECNPSRATDSQRQLQNSFAGGFEKVQAKQDTGSSRRKTKSQEVPKGPLRISRTAGRTIERRRDPDFFPIQDGIYREELLHQPLPLINTRADARCSRWRSTTKDPTC